MEDMKPRPGLLQAAKQKITELYERLFPWALEKRFLQEWTNILMSDAKVYTGMYTSLARLADGEARKPGKVLREWVTRTIYQWEGSPIAALCGRTLAPAAESGSAQDCAKWARLLLTAARQAGVTKDHKETVLTLDDASIRAYAEWDGKEIYPDDTVKVIIPAWYQNGRVLEQGQCTLIAEEESGETEQE